MIDFMASEADIDRILQTPLSCLISDAIYPDKGLPHPRLYGAFTRFLETYVLKRGVLPMEEAIRKITSVPASVMRLKNKGTIMEGKDADICVFDPASLQANADYSNPKACSSGMRAVIVAGKIALENDHLTGEVAGKILRRE